MVKNILILIFLFLGDAFFAQAVPIDTPVTQPNDLSTKKKKTSIQVSLSLAPSELIKGRVGGGFEVADSLVTFQVLYNKYLFGDFPIRDNLSTNIIINLSPKNKIAPVVLFGLDFGNEKRTLFVTPYGTPIKHVLTDDEINQYTSLLYDKREFEYRYISMNGMLGARATLNEKMNLNLLLGFTYVTYPNPRGKGFVLRAAIEPLFQVSFNYRILKYN